MKDDRDEYSGRRDVRRRDRNDDYRRDRDSRRRDDRNDNNRRSDDSRRRDDRHDNNRRSDDSRRRDDDHGRRQESRERGPECKRTQVSQRDRKEKERPGDKRQERPKERSATVTSDAAVYPSTVASNIILEVDTSIPDRRRVTMGRGITIEGEDHLAVPPPGVKMTISSQQRPSEIVQSFRESRMVSKRPRICWVPGCKEPNAFPKAHAFNYHVPEIFLDRLPPTNEQVLRGRTRALREAACWLLGRPATLEELLLHIQMQHVLSAVDNSVLTPRHIEAMTAMCGFNNLPVPAQFKLFPPESPAVLIHWKVVLLISACLDDQERRYWMDHFPVPAGLEEEDDKMEAESMQPEISYPEAFDSHFHLDRLLRECQLPEDSGLSNILARNTIPPEERVNLVGTLAVFCDPRTYPSVERLVAFPEDMSVAVGIHPKHSSLSREALDESLKQLATLLEHPKVCALGEIGLDHSVSVGEWHRQVELLERTLQLIKEDKVLVLHCRGMQGDCGTEVYFLLLHFLRRHLVPSQRIHLHCFTGNTFVLQEWLQAFPRSYFGFTNIVQRFSESQIKALCSVGEDRLLLETDAPYFPPRGSSHSSPDQLYTTAKLVADHRGSSPEYILEITSVNAKHLYWNA